MPYHIASEVQLGKGFQMLVGAHIEEFFSVFLPYLDTMPPALELVSKRADVTARRIKYENSRMFLLGWITFMNYVEILVPVDGNVVRGLPLKAVGQLGPLVIDLKAVFPLTLSQKRASRFSFSALLAL